MPTHRRKKTNKINKTSQNVQALFQQRKRSPATFDIARTSQDHGTLPRFTPGTATGRKDHKISRLRPRGQKRFTPEFGSARR